MSFSKISTIKRLDENYHHIAVVDESSVLIYDLRLTKLPVFSISHYLQDTVSLSDFLSCFNRPVSSLVPNLDYLSNLDSLLQDSLTLQNPKASR
jgi:hypothetical protein